LSQHTREAIDAEVKRLTGQAYNNAKAVRDELRARLDAAAPSAVASALPMTLPAGALDAVASLPLAVLDVPMYAIDAILRRSPALQATTIARAGAVA
jgi:hypothetical protein